MNILKCEICKTGQLVKKDGLFVCENCGTKYTSEEVTKLYSSASGKEKPETEPIKDKTETINSDLKEKDAESGSANTAERITEQSSVNAAKRYCVDVIGPYIRPKQVCACCLSSRGREITIDQKSQTTNGMRRAVYTVSVKTDLCKECINHQEEVKQKRKIISTLCLVLSCVVHAVLYLVSKGNMGLSFLAGWGSAFVLYLIIAACFHFPALSEKHTSRFESVKFSTDEMPEGYESVYSMYSRQKLSEPIRKVTFTFTNKDYAQWFRSLNIANSSEITEYKIKDTTKKISLLSLLPDKVIVVVFQGLFLQLIMLAIMGLLTARMFHG